MSDETLKKTKKPPENTPDDFDSDTELSKKPILKTPKPGNRLGAPLAEEVGGRKGPEPTRYGDWEKNGILSDF